MSLALDMHWLKSINMNTAKTSFFVFFTWMELMQIEVSFKRKTHFVIQYWTTKYLTLI